MSEAPPERRSYGKGVERRALIVRSAVEVFSERGYTSGSMREIATRAGLAQAGLLHHFTNKAELLTEVLTHRDTLIDAAIAGPDHATLRDHVLAVASYNADHRQITTLFTILSAEAVNPDHDAHEYFVERYREQHATLRQAIIDEQAAGRVRPEIDPSVGASVIAATLDGFQLQQELHPGFHPRTALESFWDTYFAIDARQVN